MAVAAGAEAQDGEDFRSQARLRVGPLYLKPSLRLDRFGVDSNVFSEPEPKRDFVVSATPGVDAWLALHRRAHLTTTFLAGGDWYAHYGGERSFNPNARYGFEASWRRFTVRAGGGHLRTRRRPDFEIDVRSNRFEKDLHGGAAVQVLPRLWIDVEARQRTLGFDGDAFLEGTYLSETLNRKERSGVLSLRWQRTALTTFVFESEVRAARFLRSPGRNSNNVIVTAGADFHPQALISGSGRIGVRRFDALGAAVANISRVVAQADLSYRMSGNAAVTFLAERDILYSFQHDAPYFVLNRYGLSVTRRLTPKLDLSGTATRNLYDYQSERRGYDVGWFISAEIGYRLNPTTRAGLQAGYIKQDSTAVARRRWSGLVLGLVLGYDL